ncbi:hypothetical protein M9Y10_024065 [Tritrichomonas musculus]|uniref:Uncharacterized protein n=1 Tax=Tritrichomonas musculus TaxID=1915356 RepID=A0ABR2L006_9EUKA
MTSRKAPQQNFPFKCQTKANMVKRGKSIERNFYIDFSTKHPNDDSIISDSAKGKSYVNENERNENRYIDSSNKNFAEEEDLKYRNFRKDRLNYNNYLLSTNAPITSALFSSTVSTSGSSRSASVRNKAKIPTLSQKVSSNKKRTSNHIEKREFSDSYQKVHKRSNPKTKGKEIILLSEDTTDIYDYDYDYNSTLDYLISDYDDYSNYDYDSDSYNDIPRNAKRNGKIIFVNGDSNLYNISEISEFNTQSSFHSHRSQRHRHQHHSKQIKQRSEQIPSRKQSESIKQRQIHGANSNSKQQKVASNRSKTILQPKFCMTEDLTESFLDDLTDHPKKEEEDEENKAIQNMIDQITSEISRVKANSRAQLKISSSIHIFVNNPTIQRFKGKISASEVYMHVPPTNVDEPNNDSSISQYTNEENDLTISAISFNNFGSPSPIPAKQKKSNNQIRRINIDSTDSEEINTKKIKSRNINYQQILNNQNENQKQKSVAKRAKLAKEDSEPRINLIRYSLISEQNKRSPPESSQKLQQEKSQNLTQNQTKKLVQSLFANNQENASNQQEKIGKVPIVKQSSPSSTNPIPSTSNNPPTNINVNPSVQNFIQQNNEIIEDLKQSNDQIQKEHENANQKAEITAKGKGPVKLINLLSSEIDISSNKTISNISAINKISNLTASESDQKGEQGSQNNDLLSDSYDETLSLDQKNVSNDQNNSKNQNLFDEDTNYNLTISSFIEPEASSNAADDFILEEIKGYFDESSSQGRTYKDANNNETNNNNNSNISVSSLANDDFHED